MMKHFLILLLLALPLTSMAQTKKNEISVSMGIWPGFPSSKYNSKFDDLKDHFPTTSDEYYTLDDIDCFDFSLTISADYYYNLNKHWAIGATMGYCWNGSDERESYDGARTLKFEGKGSTLFLMPQVRYVWHNFSHARIYSKMAVGPTLEHVKLQHNFTDRYLGDYDKHIVGFTVQFSYFGIDWGGQTVRGFAELGVGNQGIVLSGVKMMF
jgi:opacity protein-like surface antigen